MAKLGQSPPIDMIVNNLVNITFYGRKTTMEIRRYVHKHTNKVILSL